MDPALATLDPIDADKGAVLDEIATRYDPSDPAQCFDYWFKTLEARAGRRWLNGRNVLELGGATGQLTSLMCVGTQRYTLVEGSHLNCIRLRERLADVDVIESFWEDYTPTEQFSDIILFGALEHYSDPVELLARCAGWLEPGGRILISVPNGRSLHRQVGVQMGLLTDPLELVDADRIQGHLRNYDVDLMRQHITAAGLRVVHHEGLFMKLAPNRLMLDWPPELVLAIDDVAKQYPEVAAEIFMVAEVDEHARG